MIKKKRGRPAKNPAITFEKQLEQWDEGERQVDLKDLCQKLQDALAKSYVEAEDFERLVAYLRNEVSARDIVIRYLENRK